MSGVFGPHDSWRRRFDELVREMVESDLKAAKRDTLVLRHGFDAYNVRET
jgi:GDPmannose 4,6-dehydratase